MTIPIMYRALALLVIAILAAGGVFLARSRGGAPAEPAFAEAEAVAALETRVGELEEQLSAGGVLAEGVSDRVASLRQRLERQVTDLRASLRELRRAVREARTSAGSATERAEAASARAEQALTKAESLARNIRVLEDRFDDHLRRHHGSG